MMQRIQMSGYILYVEVVYGQLFLIMENEIHQKLNLHVVSESQQEMVDSLMGNEDLLFQWCFCATDWDETARRLLKGAGGFMKPHKCYSLSILCREKESYRSLNYSFEDLGILLHLKAKVKFVPCFDHQLMTIHKRTSTSEAS